MFVILKTDSYSTRILTRNAFQNLTRCIVLCRLKSIVHKRPMRNKFNRFRFQPFRVKNQNNIADFENGRL